MKGNAFLLGFIFGSIFGASWVFGHLNQWANAGPFLGVLVSAASSFFLALFFINYDQEDQ